MLIGKFAPRGNMYTILLLVMLIAGIGVYILAQINFAQEMDRMFSTRYGNDYVTPFVPGDVKIETPRRGVSNFDRKKEFNPEKDSVLEITQPMSGIGSSQSRFSTLNRNRDGMSFRNRRDAGLPSGGGGASTSALLSAGRGSSGSSERVSFSNGELRGGMSITPAFAPPPISGKTNEVLIDPGNTDPTTFIPVGDAVIPLILFAMIYVVGIIRRYGRVK